MRGLAGRRLNDLSRRLGERGLLAIVFVRVVPVGPFSIVNIVAGASHIRWRDFLLGTVIGLMPGVTVASIFVDRVAAAIREPGTGTFALLAAAGAALIALVWTISAKARALAPKRDANRAPVSAWQLSPATLRTTGLAAGIRDAGCCVATWNIHGAVGADRRYAPTRIVDVLSELDADLVALQEVPLQGAHDNFLADLEHATGYHVAAGPLFPRRGTDFGNAVLSRHAFDRVAHVDLTVDGYEPRGALDVRIDVGARRYAARAGDASGVASGRTARAGEAAARGGRGRKPAAHDAHGRSQRMVLVGSSAALAACAFSREAGRAADVSRAASGVRARPDLDLAGGLPAPVAFAMRRRWRVPHPIICRSSPRLSSDAPIRYPAGSLTHGPPSHSRRIE